MSIPQQWIVMRLVKRSNGKLAKQYWSGDRRWNDGKGGARRFESPEAAEDAYANTRNRAPGDYEIGTVPVVHSSFCATAGKYIHATRETAELAMLEMWRKRPSHRFEKRAYPCGKHWHLTSMDEEEFNASSPPPEGKVPRDQLPRPT